MFLCVTSLATANFEKEESNKLLDLVLFFYYLFIHNNTKIFYEYLRNKSSPCLSDRHHLYKDMNVSVSDLSHSSKYQEHNKL